VYWEGYQIFWKFINPWSKSSCTLHTNLHCKTNYTKVQTTTVYPRGHTTFLLRQHENISVTDKTNNPNQLWKWQNMKHNYCCTVASLRCDITFDMVSEVLHNRGFSLPEDQTYHSCDARTEVREKVKAYMPPLVRGVKRYGYTSSWPWNQMGEMVTPYTANLPPGKRPGMHCGGD